MTENADVNASFQVFPSGDSITIAPAISDRIIKYGSKLFTVVIEEQENEPNYHPIGVDGDVFQVMRGVEVEIPEAYMEVLKNAKATRLVKTVVDGKETYVPRDYAVVPYRVLSVRDLNKPEQG